MLAKIVLLNVFVCARARKSSIYWSRCKCKRFLSLFCHFFIHLHLKRQKRARKCNILSILSVEIFNAFFVLMIKWQPLITHSCILYLMMIAWQRYNKKGFRFYLFCHKTPNVEAQIAIFYGLNENGNNFYSKLIKLIMMIAQIR